MSKVLNISEAATIAIHSMALISKSKSLLSAQEISEMTGFSKNHISKVLSHLAKNNFLSSNRGPRGGFILKGRYDEISLMEIYRLFDGEIVSSTNCRMHCAACPFKSCIFGGLAEKFSKEFSEYLTENTLASV